MSYTPTENGTGTCAITDFNYCMYRLPCGVCILTDSICPLSGNGCQPTWETPFYCTTGTVMKEAENNGQTNDNRAVG